MADPTGKNPRDETTDSHCVFDLSQRMMQKLRKNSHKAHWSTVTNGWLFARLREEVDELRSALHNETPDDIANECADIANFAAMIADNVQNGKG